MAQLPKFLRLLLILFAAGSALAVELAPTFPSADACNLHTLIDQQDYAAATACVKSGTDPDMRDHQDRGPLNRLLWYGRGLSVLDKTTQPFIEALVDAGADLNHRPPGQEASAFEALLEEGVHITARPLVRRMLLRADKPVDPNASVSMRRTPPHDERRLTPLLWAIKVGDAKMAALLLEGGADPNLIPAPRMGTPLHHAVHYNQPELIRLLHRHGADIHTVSPGPILESINGDRTETGLEMLRTVLDLGALKAIENQETWLLRALSLRPNSKPLTAPQFTLIAPYLHIDFARTDSAFLEQFIENYRYAIRIADSYLPTFRAAFLHALAAGANPNGSRQHTRVGASLLQMLVSLGDGDLALELQKALLERGADPNLADKDGDTPLHQVAIDRAQLKDRLESLSAYPEVADIRPSEINSKDDLKALLDRVAGKPKMADAVKGQILREATIKRLKRFDDQESLLLAYGANPGLKNRKGQTHQDIQPEKPVE
ncbi:hypothetical protein MASR1M60_30540 [Rhodocyclaceae bacterium]